MDSFQETDAKNKEQKELDDERRRAEEETRAPQASYPVGFAGPAGEADGARRAGLAGRSRGQVRQPHAIARRLGGE